MVQHEFWMIPGTLPVYNIDVNPKLFVLDPVLDPTFQQAMKESVSRWITGTLIISKTTFVSRTGIYLDEGGKSSAMRAPEVGLQTDSPAAINILNHFGVS
jgi:hypothetical protein